MLTAFALLTTYMPPACSRHRLSSSNFCCTSPIYMRLHAHGLRPPLHIYAACMLTALLVTCHFNTGSACIALAPTTQPPHNTIQTYHQHDFDGSNNSSTSLFNYVSPCSSPTYLLPITFYQPQLPASNSILIFISPAHTHKTTHIPSNIPQFHISPTSAAPTLPFTPMIVKSLITGTPTATHSLDFTIVPPHSQYAHLHDCLPILVYLPSASIIQCLPPRTFLSATLD